MTGALVLSVFFICTGVLVLSGGIGSHKPRTDVEFDIARIAEEIEAL